jgi:sialidase-1
MGLVQGKPACSVHSPAQETATAPTALSTTAWTHIACTHDLGGEITVYVNGAAVGTYYSGQNLGPIPTAILIGASETMQPSQMAQFFPGAIDDVRIYKRALTPAEIVAIRR